MNGGASGARRSSGADDPFFGVLFLFAVGLGLAGYGWWRLGEAARVMWLSSLGYGTPPVDMLAQVEWLAGHRLGDIEGMSGAFALAGAAGMVEGHARRRTATLSGFGLRLFKLGRLSILAWLIGTAAWFVAPVAVPYELSAGVLATLLFVSVFTLSRGLRRVH